MNLINEDINAIILNIQSIHAENIYSGIKKYELRKVVPKVLPKVVFLFEAGERSAITGAFYVKSIISLPIDELWDVVGVLGTTKSRFYSYFGELLKGYAYEIGEVIKFKRPLCYKEIIELDSSFQRPQSFVYLNKLNIKRKLLIDLYITNQTKSKVSLSFASKKDLILFRSLAIKEISRNYDEIDESFASSIIESYSLGYDPNGYFTKKKDIYSIKLDNTIIGFTVVTEKIGNSIKTGPTIILNEYRNKGYGQEVRKEIEAKYRSLGYRKMYCTCSEEDSQVLKYLLKSGMKVEAHLINQYKKCSSELVLGKLISSTEKKYIKIYRKKLQVEEIVIYNKTMFSHTHHFLMKNFENSYLKVDSTFITRLLNSTGNNYLYDYAQKGKIIFLGLEKNGVIVSSIICSPKRGGAVKMNIITISNDEKSFVKLIKFIVDFFRSSNKHKLYVSVLYNDLIMIKYFEGCKFNKEGLLIEPYTNGVDMIQLGREIN